MSEGKAFIRGKVNGFLHVPEEPNTDGIVLTHGAGGNCQAPLLSVVANGFCAAGFYVLRCDLPFRQRRRFGPPSPAQAAEDRAGLRSAAAELKELTTGRVFLGGHSYGGRQASILVSEDATAAAGLLLLSYPLHPPKDPDNRRTAHFPDLHVPCLFVHGTRDPFGTTDELRDAIKLIPARAELSIVEGAGHDLKRGSFQIDELVRKPFLSSVIGLS